VAYDVRGVRDIIEHGTTGYLVQRCNVDGLHKAVRDILKDNELRMRMGQAGQKRIRQKFSINASLAVILPAVREVLEQKKIWDMKNGATELRAIYEKLITQR